MRIATLFVSSSILKNINKSKRLETFYLFKAVSARYFCNVQVPCLQHLMKTFYTASSCFCSPSVTSGFPQWWAFVFWNLVCDYFCLWCALSPWSLSLVKAQPLLCIGMSSWGLISQPAPCPIVVGGMSNKGLYFLKSPIDTVIFQYVNQYARNTVSRSTVCIFFSFLDLLPGVGGGRRCLSISPCLPLPAPGSCCHAASSLALPALLHPSGSKNRQEVLLFTWLGK